MTETQHTTNTTQTGTSFEQKLKLWKEYGTSMLPLSPVIALFLFGEGFTYLNSISESVILYFLGAGLIGTLMWMLFDSRKGRSDLAERGVTDDAIDLIDRDAQTEIYEGLLNMSMFENKDPNDPVECLMRNAVNNIAIGALIPSAYHNHHGRELIDLGMNGYILRKKNCILRAFYRADMGYRQYVTNNLCTAGVSFESIMEGFVCYWVREIVIPAVQVACLKKIAHYNKVCERSDLSSGFRQNAVLRRAKNERYIAELDVLEEHSSLILRSTVYLDRIHEGTKMSYDHYMKPYQETVEAGIRDASDLVSEIEWMTMTHDKQLQLIKQVQQDLEQKTTDKNKGHGTKRTKKDGANPRSS